MKTKNFIIVMLSIFFLGFTSCASEDDVDGKWEDNIKLSAKKVSFDSKSNSTVIKTEGVSWWLSAIKFDDANFDFHQIDTTKKDFIIKDDNFTIERKNSNEIHIFISENTSSKERVLAIGLQAGNYFDGITITQSGK